MADIASLLELHKARFGDVPTTMFMSHEDAVRALETALQTEVPAKDVNPGPGEVV